MPAYLGYRLLDTLFWHISHFCHPTFSVSRRNSLRYLRTLRRFMYSLLTELSDAILAQVADASDPIADYVQLQPFTRLRRQIERWLYSHL